MHGKQKKKKVITRRNLLKCGLYGGLAVNLSPALWISGCSSRAQTKKNNIILISVDTLRPDHLSCYGYHRNTSPYLDEFSENAMVFEKCFAHASETRFSFASLLSGFLPHETKVLESPILPPDLQTLPKILQGQGYTTAAVISN